jgi:hypothetical protein
MMKNRVGNGPLGNESRDFLGLPGKRNFMLESSDMCDDTAVICGVSILDDPIVVPVDAATFSELLISKLDLKRSDSPDSNQLGLYDSYRGVRYVINESDLYQTAH